MELYMYSFFINRGSRNTLHFIGFSYPSTISNFFDYPLPQGMALNTPFILKGQNCSTRVVIRSDKLMN